MFSEIPQSISEMRTKKAGNGNISRNNRCYDGKKVKGRENHNQFIKKRARDSSRHHFSESVSLLLFPLKWEINQNLIWVSVMIFLDNEKEGEIENVWVLRVSKREWV